MARRTKGNKMKIDKIFDTVFDKIEYIKKDRREPGAIIVSNEIYREIANGYYSPGRDGKTYPFFPDFSVMGPKMHDKLFGLPLSTLNTNNIDYIEVFAK